MPGCAGETITTNTLETSTTPAVNPYTTFNTYEMKADDIRLTRVNQPLISFEYPEVFILVDQNISPPDVLILGQSEIDFTHFQGNWPYEYISVIINELSPLKYDEEKTFYLKYWTNRLSTLGDNVTIKKVLVSGIEADYMESSKKSVSYGKQNIYRVTIFDYAGLMWQIYMTTVSSYPEPPEVQEAFEHIINTFKFLDESCNTTDSDKELDITVEYRDKEFFITNNEDVMLCDVSVILNYIDSDLSTGYECHDIMGIRSHQTRRIQNWQLKDIDGKSYVDSPDNHPVILLVQAEFAGCVNKTYTYIKTWE